MATQKTEQQQRTKNKILASQQSAVGGRFHADDVSRFAATIGMPVEEVFAFFRDFSNFPTFMKDVKEVRVLSPGKTHWVIELGNGLKAEWDAEITAERKGEMISWKSVEGSEVETWGSVWFSPAPRDYGTIVGLDLSYSVPGGKLTELLTKFTGEDPDSLALINLRRLKGYLETGVIATVEGQTSGREQGAETIQKH